MIRASLKRCLLIPLLTTMAIVVSRDCVRAQSDNEGLDLSIELVDPKVLRVCADPRNLPFSNETITEVRLGGRSVLKIRYENYKIDSSAEIRGGRSAQN